MFVFVTFNLLILAKMLLCVDVSREGVRKNFVLQQVACYVPIHVDFTLLVEALTSFLF